jgi:hypothetical protein
MLVRPLRWTRMLMYFHHMQDEAAARGEAMLVGNQL